MSIILAGLCPLKYKKNINVSVFILHEEQCTCTCKLGDKFN